jgi:hypothetical protein
MAESDLEKAVKEVKKNVDIIVAHKKELDSVFGESKKEVDKGDFEETRRSLLSTYYSYVQNHVGYMITLVLGLFGLVFAYKDLFTIIGNFIFVFLVLILLGVFYDYVGIKYWTSYTNLAILLPKNLAIELFAKLPIEKKLLYSEEAPAPCTAILEEAIHSRLKYEANDEKVPLWKRLPLKIVLKVKR